ncbi:MAG TPA: hypothetical protein VFR09_00050, partial [Alphaproteobacteria bacterium]|nr:hypothetical protein [Alphaproteobacteria bacterium]
MTEEIKKYIELDRKNYETAINRLVTNVMGEGWNSSDPQARALQDYFTLAMERGIHFSAEDLEALKGLSPKELVWKSDSLTDKNSKENREKFADAGKQRKDEMKWDNLFPENQNEIYLQLGGSGRSLDNIIADYIRERNVAAQARYEAAVAEGDRNAGKSLEQSELRLKPDDPTFLEQFHRAKGEWIQSQKFGRYLEANFEWGILDDFQYENSKKDKDTIKDGQSEIEAKAADLAMLPIIDRGIMLVGADSGISSDRYDLESLMVVISRDPQKIGEMSSGQFWRSCMAENGFNFHFVPMDIQAGTLMAYVVSRDDPQARYPLLRQALKPYQNAEGQTILAPAKVYGAASAGNTRTKDALDVVLHEFVRTRVNQGLTGQFNMDGRVYGDGQPTVINFDSQDFELDDALTRYHQSALQEYLVERAQYRQLVNDIDRKVAVGEEDEAIRRNALGRIQTY